MSENIMGGGEVGGGGGIRDVPAARKYASIAVNRAVSWLLKGEITMATGMTRGYRREVTEIIQTKTNRKAFHLEIVLRALAGGFTVKEIPATLSWGEDARKKSLWTTLIFLAGNAVRHAVLLFELKEEIARIRAAGVTAGEHRDSNG